MAEPLVTYAVSNAVATVKLNRPDRMNALTDEMVLLLHETMVKACADDAVRVIVFGGTGRGFCVGADVGGFKNLNLDTDIRKKLNWPLNMDARADYQTRHGYFSGLEKPVIGMINGAVAGMGFIYALACDVRFAAESAVFATAFARRGTCAEYGSAWMLTRVVGQATALDLLLSGRKIRADEAARMGLVNQCIPDADLEARTRAYAEEMAAMCSPNSLRILKREVYDAPFQTLSEAVIDSNRDMRFCHQTEDFKEGAASFMEKRPPRFTGR